jgi:hypothetical protein
MRNSSGLRCTLDGRRGTPCLEEAIEKEPSVDEREYLEVVKHAVPKQINPFHLVGLLHEVTSRLVHYYSAIFQLVYPKYLWLDFSCILELKKIAIQYW